MDINALLNKINWAAAVPIVSRMFLAALVLMVGFWIIKRIMRLVATAISKSNLGEEITPFLISLVDVALKFLIIFIVAGIVGVETASFIAVLGALVFAVGMALQGSLGNFAAGLIILLFKPYRIGDWIEVDEKFGKVEQIQIFNTLLLTHSNQTLVIPNGKIIEDVVTNYSTKGYVRVDLQVAMPYAESFPKVKKIIEEVLHEMPNVLNEPAPEVGIIDYDTHYIVVGVRPFAKPDDYQNVLYEANYGVKHAFHKNGIQMAYSEGVELGPIGE